MGSDSLSAGRRDALAVRLEERRGEIEQAALARVYAVSDSPPRAAGPDYADGLRRAVSAAVDLALAAVRGGDGLAPEVPAGLLVQARLAARHGVGLGTVLRRYSAGYSLLSQALVEEAAREGIGGDELAELLEVPATLFDRVVEAITEEYGRERVRPASVERRRAELVRSLLDGAFVDTSSFAYDFDGNHVAIVARGPDAGAAIGRAARSLDGRRLTVPAGEGTVWAWLGSHTPLPLERLVADPPNGLCIAVGEAGCGVAGWRQSHHQAAAAFLVAAGRPGTLVRYRDVALLAAVLQDDLLAVSLRQLYLEPLRAGRDGGALIETLCAYVQAGRNSASAAAALEISRQAVDYRVRNAEERIGRPLATCMASLEAALELDRHDRIVTLANFKSSTVSAGE